MGVSALRYRRLGLLAYCLSMFDMHVMVRMQASCIVHQMRSSTANSVYPASEATSLARNTAREIYA